MHGVEARVSASERTGVGARASERAGVEARACGYLSNALSRLCLACVLWLAGAPHAARAQPFTPTINPDASPITVSQQPEKIAVRPKASSQTLINVAFGATVNGGNTKLFAGNLGGRFGLIKGNHQLTVEGLGTMGGARGNHLTDVTWTSRSMIGRVRYDIFLSHADALFVAEAPRRDRFAGFDLRLQNQTGYLRNLFQRSDAHRFWSELGYDLTYDNFAAVDKAVMTDITTDVRNAEAAAGVPPEQSLAPPGATITRSVDMRSSEGHQFIHSARIFFGYTNRLAASANVSVGAETLIDFQDIKNVRVNGLAELTSSITGAFKLGIQSRVMFDNVPVTNTKKYDTILAVQLVYTFDSLAGAANAQCPVCDCKSQVEAARAACRAPR